MIRHWQEQGNRGKGEAARLLSAPHERAPAPGRLVVFVLEDPPP